jgi:hypothetical protein
VIRRKRSSSPRKVSAPRELVLRIANDDGELTPDNADPVQVLAFAAAYLESLQTVAADNAITFHVAGIALRTGSVELAFRIDKVVTAQKLAREVAAAMLEPDAPAPIRRLRTVLSRLPAHVHAQMQVGRWERRVDPEPVVHEQPLRELTMLRGQLIRVGGVTPAVRLRDSDGRDFSLEASKDDLRTLGTQLYREVEIEAEVERDEHGAIVAGRVLSFAVVIDEDPADAWQKWFDESAGTWDDASVEALLGRRD